MNKKPKQKQKFNRRKEKKKGVKDAKEILESSESSIEQSFEDWLENMRQYGVDIPQDVTDPKEVLEILKKQGVPIGRHIKPSDLLNHRDVSLTEEGILNQMRSEDVSESVVEFYMNPNKEGGKILADFTTEEGWFELFEQLKEGKISNIDLFQMIMSSHINIEQGIITPIEALQRAVSDDLRNNLGYHLACLLLNKMKDLKETDLTPAEIPSPRNRPVLNEREAQEWIRGLTGLLEKTISDRTIRYDGFDELIEKLNDTDNQDFDPLLNPVFDLCLEKEGIALYTITTVKIGKSDPEHPAEDEEVFYNERNAIRHLVECNPYQILEKKLADRFYNDVEPITEPFLRDKALELRKAVFERTAEHLASRF